MAMKVDNSDPQNTTWYPSYDGKLRVNPDADINRRIKVKPSHVIKISRRGVEFNKFVVEAIERRLQEGW